jgi:hypothetical protein
MAGEALDGEYLLSTDKAQIGISQALMAYDLV